MTHTKAVSLQHSESPQHHDTPNLTSLKHERQQQPYSVVHILQLSDSLDVLAMLR